MSNLQIKLSKTKSNVAYASKSFLKQALIYGTKEYRLLKEFKSERPDCVVKVKENKVDTNKTCKNLTYENMITYIKTLPNAENLLNEFNIAKQRSCIAKNPYRYVANWFKNECFENDYEFASFRKKINLDSNVSESQSNIKQAIVIPENKSKDVTIA